MPTGELGGARKIPRLILVIAVGLQLVPVVARAQSTEVTASDVERASIEELLEMRVVTASRRPQPLAEAPATVYVVTEEDIVRYGLRNLRDVIRIVPGAEWSFDQMALQGGLRGLPTNFANTLLMINGREVQNLLAGEPFISYQFQTHNVRRVEVMMGPASALYGANAFVGVINVVTKLKDPAMANAGYVEQAAGSWSTLSTGVGFQHTGKLLSFYGAMNYLVTRNEDLGDWLTENADKYRSRKQPWTPPGFNPKFGYRNEARSALVEAQASARGAYAGVLLIHNYSEGGIEQLRPTFGERMVRREQFLWYAGYEEQLLPSLKVKLEYLNFTENDLDVFTWSTGVMHPIPPDMRGNQYGGIGQNAFFGVDGAKKHRGDLQVDYAVHPTNLLVAGVAVERWDFGLGQLCCTAPNLLPTANTDLMEVLGEDQRKFWKTGIFLQDQQSLWNRAHLTVGVRLDKQSNFDLIVNPRVGLVVELWRGSRVRLLYGQAFREPTVFEQAKTQMTRPVKPAKMRSYELALEQRLGPLLSRTSVYYNDVSNAIIANPVIEALGPAATPDEPLFVNTKDHARGLEQSLQLRSDRWRGFAAYAYVDRKNYHDPFTGLQSHALDVARHKVMAGVSFDVFRSAFVSVVNVFNSSVDDEATTIDGAGKEIQRVPYYNNVMVILGARRLDLDDVTVDLSLVFDNVLNRDNLKPNMRTADPRAYVQNHINVMGRARLLF